MLNPEDIKPPFFVGEATIDGQQIWTPALAVQFNDEVLHLHRFNTLVRLFKTESANHAELRDEHGLRGLRMSQAILETMVEYEYDYQWNRVVDEESAEWLADVEGSELETEWEKYDLEAD